MFLGLRRVARARASQLQPRCARLARCGALPGARGRPQAPRLGLHCGNTRAVQTQAGLPPDPDPEAVIFEADSLAFAQELAAVRRYIMLAGVQTVPLGGALAVVSGSPLIGATGFMMVSAQVLYLRKLAQMQADRSVARLSAPTRSVPLPAISGDGHHVATLTVHVWDGTMIDRKVSAVPLGEEEEFISPLYGSGDMSFGAMVDEGRYHFTGDISKRKQAQAAPKLRRRIKGSKRQASRAKARVSKGTSRAQAQHGAGRTPTWDELMGTVVTIKRVQVPSFLQDSGWSRGDSNDDEEPAVAPKQAVVELRRQCIASVLTYALVAVGGLVFGGTAM